MKKLLVSIPISGMFLLLSSFTGAPVGKPGGYIIYSNSVGKNPVSAISSTASSLYNSLSLETKGLSKKAFETAYRGYLRLLSKKRISVPAYLTICDFSQSSRKKRLYVIDIVNQNLVMNTYVAHGRNSGAEYATRFSNKPNSFQSSLGFYITGQPYSGENGFSLRLLGIEPGINDRAYDRAIVIHGADYIDAQRMGRSFGCPAVPKNDNATLINIIKNGSCVFLYHPSKKYLYSSRVLNG